ncbi:MAG: hypothetical protein FWD78_11480 [Treponema sp.]|nr:hypothetical protein [Treponema sp.]
MKPKFLSFIVLIPAVILIPAVFLLSCCSSETLIQEILTGTASPPVFLDCKAVSSTEISFRFTGPVSMISLNLDPGAEILSVTEGEEILVTLTEPMRTGDRITADILVEDEHRNTLNVLVPFRARNSRPPSMLINEVRTIGASFNDPKKSKVEFVEFLVKNGGNLGALRLFAASYSLTKPVYEFNPIEVKSGEYIVLHFRQPFNECLDEISDKLDESGGLEAIPNARDLWIPVSQKLLHDTDAIYLVDQDDRIMDAVLLCETDGSSWNKAYLAQAADLFAAQGVWFPAGGLEPAAGTYSLAASDAVYTAATTSTRTICRDETREKGSRPENWYIANTSRESAGKPNSPDRYYK